VGPTAIPLLLADRDGKPEVPAALETAEDTAKFVGPATGVEELKLAELIIADAMAELVLFAEAVMRPEATLEGDPVPSGVERTPVPLAA